MQVCGCGVPAFKTIPFISLCSTPSLFLHNTAITHILWVGKKEDSLISWWLCCYLATANQGLGFLSAVFHANSLEKLQGNTGCLVCLLRGHITEYNQPKRGLLKPGTCFREQAIWSYSLTSLPGTFLQSMQVPWRQSGRPKLEEKLISSHAYLGSLCWKPKPEKPLIIWKAYFLPREC